MIKKLVSLLWLLLFATQAQAALVPTQLLSISSSADGTSYTPGTTFNIQSNTLLIAMIQVDYGSTPSVLSAVALTGACSHSFTNTGLGVSIGSSHRVMTWYATSGSSGTGCSITMTSGASETLTGWSIKLVERTDALVTGTNGSGGINFTNALVASNANTTSTTITFTSLLSSGNALMTCGASKLNATTVTAEWTEIGVEVSHGLANATFGCQYTIGGADLTGTLTYGATGANLANGIEIREDTSVPSSGSANKYFMLTGVGE